jgi:hypothetical protein
MKRAGAIKVVLSCTGLAGNKKKRKRRKEKKPIPNFIFLSEIGNFNVGGPVNQLIIKKRPYMWNICVPKLFY